MDREVALEFLLQWLIKNPTNGPRDGRGFCLSGCGCGALWTTDPVAWFESHLFR